MCILNLICIIKNKYFLFQIAMMHLLKHPNIIELFGFGIRSDFKHFIVMEFMENNSLYDGKFVVFLTDYRNLIYYAQFYTMIRIAQYRRHN
jgi:serine/threonine protein kinase